MNSVESGVSRRELLGKAAKIAALGAAVGTAGLIVGNEVFKGSEGIVKTDAGNFIPLYERHDAGISTENFPKSIDALDGLFRETNHGIESIEDTLATNPQEAGSILTFKTSNTDTDKIIFKLYQRNAPLVFGDISVSEHDIQDRNKLANAELWTGFVATSVLLMPHDPTRRKFLQLAFGAVASYGLYGLSNFSYLIPMLTNSIEHPEWVRRISRIDGIISHIHPEQPLIFLRNAIMANKLLLTGEHLKRKLGRKPNIAFWVGGGHSGIEDFLQLGQEACREAISLYPSLYLHHVVDDNGGAEEFSSALLAYPRAAGENQYTYDLVKITDRKLMAKL